MKKGFTLIELLAVIVVLGIIAIIAVPIITEAVETSRMEGAKVSLSRYINALEKRIYTLEFDSIKGNELIDGTYNIESLATIGIEIKGTIPKSGKVIVNDNLVTYANVSIGDYFVTYEDEKYNVANGQVPEITNLSYTVTPTNITVIVNSDFPKDKINKYYFKINNNEYVSSDNSMYTFTNLNPNTTYRITAYIENELNDTSNEVSIEAITNGIENTKYVVNTPTPSTGYVKEKNISINFDNVDANKYIKIDENATSNKNITKVCGNNELPTTCSNTNTTALNKNYWYLVNENIEVTLNTNATIYSLLQIEDTILTNSFIASNIDNISPTCLLKVTDTQITFDKITEDHLDSYEISLSTTPAYINNDGVAFDKGTFYGYVKDLAGNTGTCQVVINDATVSKYTVKEKTCSEVEKPIYSYDEETTTNVANCSNSNFTCDASHVGEIYSTCSAAKKYYTKTNYTCSSTTQESYSFGDGTTSQVSSCTENNIVCNEANANKELVSCTPVYNKIVHTCKYKNIITYDFFDEDPVVTTDCTETNSFNCTILTGRKTYTTCEINSYNKTVKKCEINTNTTYNATVSNVENNLTSCSNKSLSDCNASNVNQNIGNICTESGTYYVKTSKACKKTIDYEYAFSNETTSTNTSCTANTISKCDASNKNKVNRTCSISEYTCNDGTLINNKYCYIIKKATN